MRYASYSFSMWRALFLRLISISAMEAALRWQACCDPSNAPTQIYRIELEKFLKPMFGGRMMSNGRMPEAHETVIQLRHWMLAALVIGEAVVGRASVLLRVELTVFAA